MDKLEPLDHCYGATREEIERTLRYALDIVSDGIWDWNIRTNHVKRSPGWYSMLGYPPDSLPENVDTWRSVIHPGDFERVMRNFQAYLDGESLIYAEDYRCRCRDGSYLWISDHGRFVEFDEAGKPTRMIGAHRNIHRRKMAALELQRKNDELLALNRRLEALVEARTEALRQANEALARQVEAATRLSETDPLTQISNRRHFERILHGEWQRFQRHGHATALLMFDLDHFKRINDNHGHQIGTAPWWPSAALCVRRCGMKTALPAGAARSSSSCCPRPSAARRCSSPNACGCWSARPIRACHWG